jgi:hypothetical protein
MLTQQCAIAYNDLGRIVNKKDFGDTSTSTNDDTYFGSGCRKGKQHCHKRWGRKQVRIFGKNRGIVTSQKNSRGQYAYYLRPSELMFREYNYTWVKANLFSTDIVLLGSVLDCNQYGIPKVNGYTSSSYKMPPPLAEIVSDTQDMVFENDVDIKTSIIQTALSTLNTEVSSQMGDFLSTTYTLDNCDIKSESKGATTRVVRNQYNDETIGEDDLVGKTITLLGVQTILNTLLANDKQILLPVITNKSEYRNGVTITKNTEGDLVLNCDSLVNTIFEGSKGMFENNTANINSKTGSISNENCGTYYPMFSRLLNGYNEMLDQIYTDDLKDKIKNTCQETFKKYGGSSTNVIEHFYRFQKKTVDKVQLDGEDETTYAELSGIDWGYNPFKTGDEDDTTRMENQNAGHFLEIGCTFSLSNIKSCVNLQRVCEIGGEISQSHYYYNTSSRTWNLLDPTGIIAKREVIDAGIRSSFATLNSKKLSVIYDTNNGYKKYTFMPYNPVSFMGDLEYREEISGLKLLKDKTPGLKVYDNFGLIETQSLSYRAFRFNTTGTSVSDKFLIEQKSEHGSKSLFFMPQYENSFYFYFGLRDGNTAIDRLYTEYYAPCSVNSDVPEVLFTVNGKRGNGFKLHYSTENMSKIKSITVKFNNVKLKLGEGFTWDQKKSIINVQEEGRYTIRLKDTSNQVVKSIVVCSNSDYEQEPPEPKSILIRKYLTYSNKWLVYFKPINCKVTKYRCDNTSYGGLNYEEGEWYLLGENFPFEAEPNSTHLFEFSEGEKLIYSDRITFNEGMIIENSGCENNLCTISYRPINFFVESVESESISNINYTNKTFSIAENTNSVVVFKNSDESIIIERTVNTISSSEPTPEPDDDYNITLHVERQSNGFTVHFTITPTTFAVKKIYLNDLDTNATIWNNGDIGGGVYGDHGMFSGEFIGMNVVVFENANGDRLTRYINTDFDITIKNVNYEGNVCKVSYEQEGFEVAIIDSNKVYDNCELKGGVYDLNTSNKTFKIYNGYNDQDGTYIYLKFINSDGSIKVMKKIQTNPTAACKACGYNPSDT